MIELNYAIGATAAGAILCFTVAFYLALRHRARQTRSAMVHRLRAAQEGLDDAAAEYSSSKRTKSGRSETLAHIVYQAGLGRSFGEYVLRHLAWILPLLLLIVLTSRNPVFVGAAVLLGCMAIYGHLLYLRSKRLQRFDEQLPRALDLMMFSLRAGKSLEEALRVAGEELPDPLGDELLHCYDETAVGLPVETTLGQLRTRWPQSSGLSALVEAIEVLKQTGGNLIEVMHSISTSLVDRTLYEAKYRALTAEGRISGFILMGLPLIACLMQGILMPQQLNNILGQPVGRAVLLLAITMWIVGCAWVLRLVRPNA